MTETFLLLPHSSSVQQTFELSPAVVSVFGFLPRYWMFAHMFPPPQSNPGLNRPAEGPALCSATGLNFTMLTLSPWLPFPNVAVAQLAHHGYW